ncbi:unnamed protein product [Dibothriocephalus latus]|uniref:Uncharacterized protein n=1 Tax=Dibothriocephalus latus TaxID=60516 RepID=A0A3P7LKR7_DIBLA|nr:unnamed protein product [Dibothriocephalus latus]
MELTSRRPCLSATVSAVKFATFKWSPLNSLSSWSSRPVLPLRIRRRRSWVPMIPTATLEYPCIAASTLSTPSLIKSLPNLLASGIWLLVSSPHALADKISHVKMRLQHPSKLF